jgi:2-keto-4-pentenoate hydratase/2-oxohepta-3-ene-1,7-dioic acid hydratase in catechol pathway
MKYASFKRNGVASWGIVDGSVIADVGALLQTSYPTLRAAIAADALDRAGTLAKDAERMAVNSVTLLPVIADPPKILCVGLNYETHRRETGRSETEHPTIFTRFADSLIAHGANIIRPRVSTSLDFEGELAVVIGKAGRYISRQSAMQHVVGYTCHNDATLRDWQRHTTQFTPGKTFPGTGPLGPYLVTPDEIADLESSVLETRLNGAVVQSANIGQMIFSIPRLIEYISSFTPLGAGDIIATGTPGGVGFKREPPLYMKPGDRIEVDITGVGLLVNGVADEA